MSTRKAPSKSATLFESGTVKKGNDGNKWVIVTNKVGVKRWQKVTGASANAATKPMKNKTKKSIRVCLYCSENSVWGKNKPLEDFWQSLASSKKVVLVEKGGKHKIFTMPTGRVTVNKMYNTFDNDTNIVAVLSSNMSQDAYEMYLYPKAKDKTVDYVIKNYKKYFKSAGPIPADLVAKGVPAQKKVLLPA